MEQSMHENTSWQLISSDIVTGKIGHPAGLACGLSPCASGSSQQILQLAFP